MDLSLFWIPSTLIAALAQTGRNAAQRSLTQRIGVIGATQVRFLYGFPFALVFLGLVLAVGHETLPHGGWDFWGFALSGALAQIAATALMLAAMRDKSFAVVTAYTKTEPVQIALVGLLVLGDPLSLSVVCAILVATLGVWVLSVKPGLSVTSSGIRPMIYGLGAGALFALAAVGFRGAIQALDSGSFVLRASVTLVSSLGLQTAMLVLWLSVFKRSALVATLQAWRPSLAAGFLGALASQFWFIGFSLTTAANVRTLALVEVVFAQAVSVLYHRHPLSSREVLGLAMVVMGVALLLRASF